jgi:protein SCO1/2
VNLSPRARLLAGFLFANLAIAVVAALLWLNRPAPPPRIQGIFLTEARALPEFQLLDHHNRPFTNADLKGRWHLVSYGYTTCPDVCPTTLSQLAIVDHDLKAQGHDDLDVLFYTVDHARDTVAQMATFVPYFDPDFLGLTHTDDNNLYRPFEQGLGIVAQLLPRTEPGSNPDEYQVVHGVKLALLNPRGELQATFDPDNRGPGTHTFTPATIERDYLAIRRYLD